MNTAGRLLTIYDRLINRGRGKETSMLTVWAEVFDLPPNSTHLEDDVVTCIQAMRSEMELLRSKLAAIDVPEDLMHPGMARLRNITSTVHINTPWSGLRDEALKPENRLAFMWANWALRDEAEDDMPVDELAALRSELDALEVSLQDTEMTAYLKSFIQRQIDAIRAALRMYPIRGVRPIEEAARTIVGTCNLEASVLAKEFDKASEPAKSIFVQAGQFIDKTAKVADNLDKIRKAGEGAYTLAGSVGPSLLPWVPAILKSLGG